MEVLLFEKYLNCITEHSHDHGEEAHTPVVQPGSPAKTAGDKTGSRTGVLPLTTDDLDTSGDAINGASRPQSRGDSYTKLYGYPAATRASLVQTAQSLEAGTSNPQLQRYYDDPTTESNDAGPSVTIASENEETEVAQDTQEGAADTPFLTVETPMTAAAIGSKSPTSRPHSHSHHSHSKGGHTHSGSMNMHALILHVIGDALGNVGVIATGLVIWLSTWEYRFYFDPVISLVITVIIFSSAMPLGAVLLFFFIFTWQYGQAQRLSISTKCFFHPPSSSSFHDIATRSPRRYPESVWRSFGP